MKMTYTQWGLLLDIFQNDNKVQGFRCNSRILKVLLRNKWVEETNGYISVTQLGMDAASEQMASLYDRFSF